MEKNRLSAANIKNVSGRESGVATQSSVAKVADPDPKPESSATQPTVYQVIPASEWKNYLSGAMSDIHAALRGIRRTIFFLLCLHNV